MIASMLAPEDSPMTTAFIGFPLELMLSGVL
jgi:hypothetical protein